MKTLFVFAAIAIAGPSFAESHSTQSDAALGEKAFRQCVSCHVIKNDVGETLAGKNGRIGPNLYGIVGRQAGSLEGFRFRKSIIAAGEAGLTWTPELLAAYVQNPTEFLREFLDDKKAKSGMGFKVRKETDANNLAAFLSKFSTPGE